MKFATVDNQTRDGQVVLVNKELTEAVYIAEISQTLQNLLDNWSELSSQCAELYANWDKIDKTDLLDFKKLNLRSPLPRAYQWLDASAYVRHVELVRKARGAEMPENFWTDPLMYQGASDDFLGPNDCIKIPDLNWGVDFEAEVVVVTNDIPMGTTPDQAKSKIILLGLVNDISLRNLIPNELAKNFGFVHGKPASSFSPVFVTPDELGDSWDGGKLNLPLESYLNNKLFGKPNAGEDMTFDFPTLLAHAAKTRNLTAGSIIGSGTVSNSDRTVGSSCIAEQRMNEKIEQGNVTTEFMQYGDNIKIQMLDKQGQTIFGEINQAVVPL